MIKLTSVIFSIVGLIFINFQFSHVISNEYSPLLSRKLLASDGSYTQQLGNVRNQPLLVFKESGRGASGWRAIARQHLGFSNQWPQVQRDLIYFYRDRESEMFFNPQRANMIESATNYGEWMHSDDLLAISVMYARNIHVYSTKNQDPTFNLNGASPPEIMEPEMFGVTPTTQQPIQIVNWWNWQWDSVAPTNALAMHVEQLPPPPHRAYPIFLRSYDGAVLECTATNGVLHMQSEFSAVNPSTMSVEFEDVVNHGNYVECKIKIGGSYLYLSNGILTFNSDYSLANTFHIYSDGDNNGQILREGAHLRIVNPSNGMVLDTSGTMNVLSIQQASQVLSEDWKQSSFYIDSEKNWQQLNTRSDGVLFNVAVSRIAKLQGISFNEALEMVNNVFGGDVQSAEEQMSQ